MTNSDRKTDIALRAPLFGRYFQAGLLFAQFHGMRRIEYLVTSGAQSKIDNLKRDLCLHLQRIAMRNQWSQRQAAAHLGTTASCLSSVYNYRLERLTLSQLFRYLAIAEPRFEVLISI